jgi:AcrR family transcriptional regulator
MAPVGLRERNKQKMRTAISDAATRLFIKRGFDHVTVAEIAEAAGVSTMTVFNHFQRKEDLFFDRKGESIALIRTALAERPEQEAPVEVLERLSYDFLKKTQALQKELPGFWDVVAQSAPLRARAREMRDTAVENIAGALAAAARRSTPDIDAHLIASLFVAAWQTVLVETIRLSDQGSSSAKIRRTIHQLLGRALKAVSAAAAGTPYGERS